METQNGATSAQSQPTSIPSSSTLDSTLKVETIEPAHTGSDITQQAPEVPDIGYIPLQDFLGLSTVDEDQKEKLKYIWDEVGKGRSREETLEEIKNIKYRLSPPDIGENYLHKLYSYVRLIGEGRSIEREKRVYES